MRNRSELEQFRDKRREIEMGAGFRKMYLIPHGDVIFDVISSEAFGWEHVSMVVIYGNSPLDFDTRIPTHEEMAFLKDMFWNDNEICFQVHPDKSNYVNINEDCLHLWKRTGECYKEAEIVKDFIKSFPKNTSSSVHVEFLELYGQKHCIVTGPNRWPTWNELCQIKRQYFGTDISAVQYQFSKEIDLNPNFTVVISTAPTHLPEAWRV